MAVLAATAINAVSNQTGVTAETLGHSLMTQFEGLEFRPVTLPFVSDLDKAHDVVRRINRAGEETGLRPIVFSTLVQDELRDVVVGANALFLDLFQVFIAPLEAELAAKSSHAAGRSHGIANSHEYFARYMRFGRRERRGLRHRQAGRPQPVTGMHQHDQDDDRQRRVIHIAPIEVAGAGEVVELVTEQAVAPAGGELQGHDRQRRDERAHDHPANAAGPLRPSRSNAWAKRTALRWTRVWRRRWRTMPASPSGARRRSTASPRRTSSRSTGSAGRK